MFSVTLALQKVHKIIVKKKGKTKLSRARLLGTVFIAGAVLDF